MTTHKLQIPRAPAGIYLRFYAERLKNGRWRLDYETNATTYTRALEGMQTAFASARRKYSNEAMPEKSVEIDLALLILREMEERFLTEKDASPVKHHYSVAWNLVPSHWKQTLEDIYLQNHKPSPEKTEKQPGFGN